MNLFEVIIMLLVRLVLKCYDFKVIKTYKVQGSTLIYCTRNNRGILLRYSSKEGVLTLEEEDVIFQDLIFRKSLGL